MIDYDQPDVDPIVAEVRRAREAYAARFGYDLREIFADLQRRAEEAGRAGQKVVSLPPRRPSGWVEPAKEAG